MPPISPRVSLPGSRRSAPSNATDTGRAAPSQILTVSILVKRNTPLSLEALPGGRISREEFNQKYAADPASFAALRSFAHNYGLSVDENASSLPRRTMVLLGTVRNLEQAFGVQLHNYQIAESNFCSFTGSITLPEEHAQIVEAVLGLDERPLAKPHLRILTPDERLRAQQAGAGYNPPQVAELYRFPASATGAGQTIGIIELGGGYNPSDLSTYFSGLGLATPSVSSISVDGAVNAPTTPSSADAEVALDIEVAGSIANAAAIAVYFTPNTDRGFIDAVTTAVHDTTHNPTILSISWGAPESSWTQASLSALNDACKSAAALGITITVASGDQGSSDGLSGNHVDFPASSPYVTGCGGTKLIGSGSTIVSQVVWNNGTQGGATGGGVSNDFPLPSWQAGANVPPPTTASGGRGVPDVAGDASPETGYNIFVDGEQEIVGGTSAVAPLWAALIALINQGRSTSAGFLNPTLYANPSAFSPITSGNNGAFSAGPGWNACTGLGSPIGTAIASALDHSTSTT
ncbi:MAG: S53 family peptidase [Acidobacteriaceae bacterium]